VIRHREEPPGPAFGGPDAKLSDEAIQSFCAALDCFAEPVIGRSFAPTRWLAMAMKNPYFGCGTIRM
jgi:hypothetical protein